MDNRELLKQKLNHMKAKRTKRDVIIKKKDKHDEKKKEQDKKEEKSIDFDNGMPDLEDY